MMSRAYVNYLYSERKLSSYFESVHVVKCFHMRSAQLQSRLHIMLDVSEQSRYRPRCNLSVATNEIFSLLIRCYSVHVLSQPCLANIGQSESQLERIAVASVWRWAFSVAEPCLAVDLLDLKVFPQTKGCTTGMGFVLTFYRITFVHQNLLSWPTCVDLLRLA